MFKTPLHRKGSVYLVVLSTTLFVTTIALLGVEAQRATARSVELLISSAKARALAQSGFEIALQDLNTRDWRTSMSSGDTVLSLDDGAGNQCLVTISDPADGNLGDDPSEEVQLDIKAGSGDAVQSFSTRLTQSVRADAALSYSLFTAGTTYFSEATFSANRAIYSLGTVIAEASSIIAPVDSAGSITGRNYSGTTRPNLAKEKPTDAGVIALWEKRATPININDIPSNLIRNVAIGPGVNPYGTHMVNPNGIYVIDCRGNALTVSNCRIFATLIIKNCPTLIFTGSVSIQAPSETQPTLLIDGSVEISTSNTNLSELTSLTNFNPVGAPDNGVSDIDILDTYPSRITGLLYIRDSLELAGTSRLVGVTIVGGDTEIYSNIGLQYNPAFASNPPEGFKSLGPLTVVNNSTRSAR
jgi:hypothetical protein